MPRLAAPHVYGPSLRSRAAAAAGELTFLDAPSFPRNMPQTWHANWAFVANDLGLAMVVGEWGGSAHGADRVWQEAFVQYLLDTKLSSFAWSVTVLASPHPTYAMTLCSLHPHNLHNSSMPLAHPLPQCSIGPSTATTARPKGY